MLGVGGWGRLETSLPIVEMPWRKGSLPFRVKIGLPTQNPGVLEAVDRAGEGTPPSQTSDSPSQLEDWAWPLPSPASKSGLLESCPCGLLLNLRQIVDLPVTSPSP